MSITTAELVKYGCASEVEADTGTVGGAIALTVKHEDMPQSGATVPKVKSSAAGDTTQTVTITGRLASGAIDSEGVTLNGTTAVNYTKSFERILKVVKSATTAGTVTVYMNDGTTAIVALLPAVTSNRRAFYDAASEASQVIRYEKEYWKNENGTLTLNAAKLNLTADPSANIRMGVETSGSQTSTNRRTAPSTVTFADTEIDITSLAAGASVGLWIEQTLGAGAAAFKSTFTTQLSGTST